MGGNPGAYGISDYDNILLCCNLGEENPDFWVSATEEEDENHLQHGQLLA